MSLEITNLVKGANMKHKGYNVNWIAITCLSICVALVFISKTINGSIGWSIATWYGFLLYRETERK